MHPQLPGIVFDDRSGVMQQICVYLRSSAVLFFKILLSYFSVTSKQRIFDKYFGNTLRSSRALRCLILDNNNELIRTRTNSGSIIGLFKLINLEKDNQPQSTQRAQSPVFSVSSVISVVFSNTYLPIGNDISNFRVYGC